MNKRKQSILLARIFKIAELAAEVRPWHEMGLSVEGAEGRNLVGETILSAFSEAGNYEDYSDE